MAICAPWAGAQQTLGAVNGTVVDSSGAAVSGSIVTVTDAAIGVTRTTTAQGTASSRSSISPSEPIVCKRPTMASTP